MALQSFAGNPASHAQRALASFTGNADRSNTLLSDLVSGMRQEFKQLIQEATVRIKQEVEATMKADQNRVTESKTATDIKAADREHQHSSTAESDLEMFLRKILQDGEISEDELAYLLQALGSMEEAMAPAAPPAASGGDYGGDYGGGGSGGGGGNRSGGSRSRASRGSGNSGGGNSGGGSGEAAPASPRFKHSTVPGPAQRNPSPAANPPSGGPQAAGPGQDSTAGPAGPVSRLGETNPKGNDGAADPSAGAPAQTASAGRSNDPAFDNIAGPTGSVNLGNTKVTVQGGTPEQQSQTTGLMQQMYDKDPGFKQGIDSKAATGIDVTIRDLPGNTAGYATVGGHQMSFDPEHMRPDVFAHTIGHEVAHNLGMNHGAELDAFAERTAAAVG